LDQDFNSLDAQREACEAYIKSQKQEGWMALPALYDDGGLSGGDMDRPALGRLLADIAEGKIDTVVVYKVDRLTRSLADFAKIVEIFDQREVAFVAVTQQFNTTTSMGRLTLNMLLSFAQFEREVTAERIRDKIAASKKKGMWMGGVPPLGYDTWDRKLVVNQSEAETVQHIFERYVTLGSVHALRDELSENGIVSKRRTSRQGRVSGGKPLARGALYLMLQNPIYRGEIGHKGERYPGQHQAIIDQKLWDRVQEKLKANRVERKTGTLAKQPSLLAGLAYDDHGERLVPTHANKKGTRYRYYVSQNLIKQSKAKTGDKGWRLPASDLEGLIEERFTTFLADDAEVFATVEAYVDDISERKRIIEQAAALAQSWAELDPGTRKTMLQTIVHRIEVHPGNVVLEIRPQRLAQIVDPNPELALTTDGDDVDSLTLVIPARLKRNGLAMTLKVDGGTPAKTLDRSLLRLLTLAERYRDSVLQGQGRSIKDLAAEAGVGTSYFTRVFRLSFLAPDITKAILQGRQPKSLTAKRLSTDIRISPYWTEQRKQLGFS
jgi:DNA invertase Pin-like site-specific DNA recombinase